MVTAEFSLGLQKVFVQTLLSLSLGRSFAILVVDYYLDSASAAESEHLYNASGPFMTWGQLVPPADSHGVGLV